MTSPGDLAAIATATVAAVFALAFAFGAIVARTNFCTMGSVADIVSFGDWTRMRQWLLAIAVAILGTNLLAAAGVIDTADSFYTSPRFMPLAYLIGGLMFGFGMVLTGGCGSKSLVRAGGGSLKSLVVLVVLGIVAYISLRGLLAVFRVGVIEPVGVRLDTPQDLPSLLAGAAMTKAALQVGLALLISAGLLVAVFRDRSFRTFDNLLAGVGIGTIIVGAWAISGTIGHVEEHPNTLQEAFLRTNSGRMESLSFVAPVAYTIDYLMFFSDTSKVVTIGIAAVVGMISGSAAYALIARQFRWEGFRDTEDTANHLVGAALMGFGGVTALGCTVGQGLSGVSTLALGSFIALAAIVSGAVLALKYQAWRLDRIA
ncbi:MAG TPA: YeeE/YedE family protein [Burkholderiaceae bacterium]|nr:YeeE/YedE family protein [Burkholderiaceae bacterium]